MGETYKIENCRACDSPSLEEMFSLGEQHVTNFIGSETEQGERIPLDLVLCESCSLLQLSHSASPKLTWNDQYWYKSGISSTIKDDLKDIATKSQKIIPLNQENIVIDIGCNDGTLFDYYNAPVVKIGFEPSKNVAKEARAKGYFVFNDFFNETPFRQIFGNEKAKIITAISMFYDLDNPNQFLKDIVSLLDKNGLFVIQQNYLASMLEQNAFDNICHEHREYYSLNSLEKLLGKHDLEVFDIEENSISGGSIRTFIRQKGGNLYATPKAKERIEQVRKKEILLGLNTPKPYLEFADRISQIKGQLLDFLNEQKASGKKICIYGASTRGNVALQYFGLGPDSIDCIADKNSDKWGKKTVGSLIPIVSPEEMRKREPDYLLVNTWHFLDEIIKQEEEYHNSGGRFVVALPDFKII